MPPKAKFSREKIVSAAFGIIRESGEEALTARKIAARLGVSTKPIFTYFKTMDELKDEVFNAACGFYCEYAESGMKGKVPLPGFCERYISFAKEEPKLYRFLFLSSRSNSKSVSLGLPGGLYSSVLESIMQFYELDEEAARSFLLNMLIVSQGFSSMIVSGSCPFSNDEIMKIGSGISFALCKAYKDIPDFASEDLEVSHLYSQLFNHTQGEKPGFSGEKQCLMP